ncbi:membrane protein [Ectothiorhodospira haloalkaliphila]|uniref:Membrane protein n=1 Tax=Ectothiorhodospira haloalkaliphila TaxID=421628 RepID=W8KJ18_9GAMM|nr:Bax inhibitor-1/YccA family protein [Ectothiorhodospira haloalkaliphila]AHK79774.1 membrane protein [Ectothiorhodospira haloalkaliphila]
MIPDIGMPLMRGMGSPLLNLPAGMRSASVAVNRQREAPLSRASVVRATGLLFSLSLLAILLMLVQFYPGVAAGNEQAANLARNIGFGGGVFGLSLVMLTAFYRHWAPYTAPVYGFSGGLFMSGLALAMEQRFPGIAVQSIVVTLCLMLSLYSLYAMRVVQVSRRMFVVVYALTATIALVYLLGFVLILTGVSLPFLHGTGVGGMIWFAFIVVVASMNLLVDFRRIDLACQRPQPLWMRWFLALGLLVTMVWLYISVLRLLANIKR